MNENPLNIKRHFENKRISKFQHKFFGFFSAHLNFKSFLNPRDYLVNPNIVSWNFTTINFAFNRTFSCKFSGNSKVPGKITLSAITFLVQPENSQHEKIMENSLKDSCGFSKAKKRVCENFHCHLNNNKFSDTIKNLNPNLWNHLG